MKRFCNHAICCVLLGLILSACSSNPNSTHRGDLLDLKVTAQRMDARIHEAGLEFRNVHAEATNDVVVLFGTVSSPQLRSRAEEIARSVRRPAQLDNRLQIEK
jgi:osmotically-inducible protein OsmY